MTWRTREPGDYDTVTDGYFGSADEISPQGMPLALDEVYAGRQVVYRRRKAVVLAVLPVGTPSGSEVVLARVQFPRGGEQTVFAGQLESRP